MEFRYLTQHEEQFIRRDVEELANDVHMLVEDVADDLALHAERDAPTNPTIAELAFLYKTIANEARERNRFRKGM